MHTVQHGLQQITQTRQMAQQLIQQTQQGSQQYRMMLQQEQQNVQMLEQILQREKQAVQALEQSLYNHDLAITRCQEIVNMCNQMQQELSTNTSPMFGTQTGLYQPFNQQSTQFSANSRFHQ